MSEVKSKGFLIQFTGDESVGVLNQQWKLTGDFTFSDQYDFNVFKKKIELAFHYCSDVPVLVESIEERSDAINKEIEQYGGKHHA